METSESSLKRSRKSLKQGRAQMAMKLPQQEKKRRVQWKSTIKEKEMSSMMGGLPEPTVGMPEDMEAGIEEGTTIEEASIGIILEQTPTEEGGEREEEEGTLRGTMRAISTEKVITTEGEEGTMKEAEALTEGEVEATFMKGKSTLRRTVTTRNTLMNLKSRMTTPSRNSWTMMGINL